MADQDWKEVTFTNKKTVGLSSARAVANGTFHTLLSASLFGYVHRVLI